MDTTTWSVQCNAPAKKTSGFAVTKKVVCDCVNLYDVGVITLGSLVSHFLYLGAFSGDGDDIASYFLYGLFAALANTRASHWARIYDFSNLSQLRWQLSRVTAAWLTILVGGLTVAFLTKSSSEISRGWLVLWFSGSLFSMVLGRVVVARLLVRWQRQGKFMRRVALITDESEKATALNRIQTANGDPILLTGIFGVDEISKLTRDVDIDEVIVALPLLERHRLNEVIAQLSALPIDVSVAIDLPIPATTIKQFELQPGGLLGRVSDRPLKNWNALHKRLLDLLVAASALVVLGPVMAVIAILIKLDSPGPVIFRQRRYGYANQSIVIYKFRSLRIEATDANAAQLVTKNDNRVTRIGGWLRKLSLDELPQIFNVIKGDMSIVGPRPHAMQAKAGDRYYQDVVKNYVARHRVKPGITGWAQINGWRGETDCEEKILKRVEFDQYYIEHWSIWLDISIMFKTIFVVFKKSNAY